MPGPFGRDNLILSGAASHQPNRSRSKREKAKRGAASLIRALEHWLRLRMEVERRAGYFLGAGAGAGAAGFAAGAMGEVADGTLVTFCN